jgi:DNA-binding transcriptional ArsR family regulator
MLDNDEQPLDDSFEPEAVRRISDVETLRAISDATRMRILETMVQREDGAWSVKELAAALQVPQTRLYHHVELLVERDLVRAVQRRVVSGIIETRYRVTARSFQLDRSLFAGATAEEQAVLHDALIAVFDTAREEIEQAIRARAIDLGDGADDSRKILLTRGLARMTPARATELRARLQALVDEFDDNAADGIAVGIVVAVYPMPPSKEPTDG